MRFSTATIFSALVALAAAATDPDYSKNPSGNSIISPGLNELVPEGKTYTIKWTPTTTGPISLVLLRGPSNNVKPIKTLADSIANSGEFKWTPGSDLTPDTTHYGLLLVVEGTGQYQYSTQFGLSAAAGSSSGSTTVEVSETTTICPETETAGPTATPTPATTTVETTESTTICPETETTAPAISTPTWSTVIASSEVTTTICPETETASASSIPVVVPTGVSSSSSKAVTSSARSSTVSPSGTASASPSASSPVYAGAASTNAISFGAVFAGLLAAFAI